MTQLNLSEVLGKDSNFLIKQNKEKLIVNKPRRLPLEIPKTIKLSEELLKSLFLIFGDGHYKSKLNLTNHIHRIHNYTIQSLENELGIPREIWRLRIIHSKSQDKKLIDAVKQYWMGALNFNDKQLYPTISPSFVYKTCKEGIARIQIDKMNIPDVIRIIIEEVIFLIQKDKLSEKEYCHIFDGILNAEGSVSKEYNGIHKITISFNKSEKDLFRTIFTKLIPISMLKEKNDRFTISKWKNIYQLIKTFVEFDIIPFSLRPKDAFNLVSGFLNYKRTEALRNYLNTIQKYPNMSFSKVADLSHRDWKSAKLTLQIRTKEFIKIEKFKNKHLTTLSKEGKNLLKIIKKLEDWLIILNKMIEEDSILSKKLEVVN